MPKLEDITQYALALIDSEVTAAVRTYLRSDEGEPWLRNDAIDSLYERVGADEYDKTHGDPDGFDYFDRAPARAALDDLLCDVHASR